MSTSTTSIQPKFKECVGEFDKDPSSFHSWVRLISGIVRNLPGGAQLEDFLDSHLGRERHASKTRPSFLEHPDLDFSDFYDASDLQDEGEVEANEGDSPRTQNSTTSSSTRPKKYSDLTRDSVDLDCRLFHVLFTIVKGSYRHLITDLTGLYARYTFAIIAMWQHANLSSSNRRTTAMSEMQNLRYDGDAGKWKIELVSRAREVYAAGVTIEHFIMQCAFASFEGKNSQVQGLIAQDINSDGVVQEGMSLDKLASKYSSFMATLNSGKYANRIHQVGKKKWCHNCKAYGHHTRDCDKANDDIDEDQGDAAGGDQPQPITPTKGKSHRKTKNKDKDTGNKRECDYCHKTGHTEDTCYLKERHERERSQSASRTNDTNSEQEPMAPANPIDNVTRNNQMAFSDQALADLSRRLKSGEIKLM